MPYQKMNVVISGSTGFIGSSLLSLIETSGFHSVKVLNRKKHDILNPSSLGALLRGADVVVHLAGANKGTDFELFKVNALGTQGVLEGMAEYCPQARLIFASSTQVYWSRSFYGFSKRTAEQLIEHYAKTRSLRATVLRLSNVYGPRGTPFYNSVISTFVHQVARGMPLHVKGDGSQMRDFVFVTDVAEAVMKSIRYRPGKRFNVFDICTGESTSLNALVQILEDISGHSIVVRYEKGETEVVPRTRIDGSLAKKVLRWQPRVSLEDGLRSVVREP